MLDFVKAGFRKRERDELARGHVELLPPPLARHQIHVVTMAANPLLARVLLPWHHLATAWAPTAGDRQSN